MKLSTIVSFVLAGGTLVAAAPTAVEVAGPEYTTPCTCPPANGEAPDPNAWPPICTGPCQPDRSTSTATTMSKSSITATSSSTHHACPTDCVCPDQAPNYPMMPACCPHVRNCPSWPTSTSMTPTLTPSPILVLNKKDDVPPPISGCWWNHQIVDCDQIPTITKRAATVPCSTYGISPAPDAWPPACQITGGFDCQWWNRMSSASWVGLPPMPTSCIPSSTTVVPIITPPPSPVLNTKDDDSIPISWESCLTRGLLTHCYGDPDSTRVPTGNPYTWYSSSTHRSFETITRRAELYTQPCIDLPPGNTPVPDSWPPVCAPHYDECSYYWSMSAGLSTLTESLWHYTMAPPPASCTTPPNNNASSTITATTTAF